MTGGYGGIFGSMVEGPYITNIPTRKHTWKSDVRVTQLPKAIDGQVRRNGKFTKVRVVIKNSAGELLPEAIPKVSLLKGDSWFDDDGGPNPENEKGINANIEQLLGYPLAGIVAEGTAPYASMSASPTRALEKAVLNGLPVVRTARGDASGLVQVNSNNLFIEGNNLTTTKARYLLVAALMKLGPLPLAADPEKPTAAETEQAVSSLTSALIGGLLGWNVVGSGTIAVREDVSGWVRIDTPIPSHFVYNVDLLPMTFRSFCQISAIGNDLVSPQPSLSFTFCFVAS